MRDVNVDCGFETVIERQLNYSKVVLRMCAWRGVCVYSVCVCVWVTKWILTWKVITRKEIITLWSKQNRWSHKSSVHMLDWCLCCRTMNHCLSMLQSKHKGSYKLKMLFFFLLLNPSGQISDILFNFVKDLLQPENELWEKYSWNRG